MLLSLFVSLSVCLCVSNFAQKLVNGFAWNFQGKLAIGQWRDDYIFVAIQIATLVRRVPGLFVPKTFRSQERIVPMGNFRCRDFRSRELSFPWNESSGPFRSWELSFPGNESSWELSFPGPIRFEELSFPGLFVPRNFRSSDYFTRR